MNSGSPGEIVDSWSDAHVTGVESVGGLIGEVDVSSGSPVTNCHASGDVTGEQYIGGLIGYLDQASITLSTSSGSVIAVRPDPRDKYDYLESAGGLVGRAFGADSSILDCMNTASVIGAERTGGLVGESDGRITRCVAANSTSGGRLAWVGGLVGFNWTTGIVQDSFSSGTVKYGYSAGGIVGLNWGAIERSASTSRLPFDNGVATYLGGFCGTNAGTIRDSFTANYIEPAGPNVGLFCSRNFLEPSDQLGSLIRGAISRSHSVRTIGGWPSTVGFLADLDDSYGELGTGPGFEGDEHGTVTGSFWDTDLNTNNDFTVAIGLPTKQMQQAATYTAAGWDFTNVWTIDEGASYPYFKDRNFTVTAFAAVDAPGSVSGGGTFYQGDEVTLTAAPDPNHRFIGWFVDGAMVAQNETFAFPAFVDWQVEAVFGLVQHQVTLQSKPSEGALLLTGDGTYDLGTDVTVEAVPMSGYYFLRWSEGGNEISAEREFSFTVDGDRTLLAEFSFNVEATPNDATLGTVMGSGVFEVGDPVTLTATPTEHAHFVNWTVDGVEVSTDPDYEFTAASHELVKANFAIDQDEIAATADPTGGGTVDGAGMHEWGSEITLNAIPEDGFVFLHWIEDGNIISADPVLTFTVSADRSLTAVFSQYLISVASNDEAQGTVTGGGYFLAGDEVTVSAAPAPNHHFVGWTENGTTVSTDSSYTFTAQAPRNLVGVFAIDTFEITVQVVPATGGSVSGTGTYAYGSTAELIVDLAEGFSLRDWRLGNTTVYYDDQWSFEVTEDRAYTIRVYEHLVWVSSGNPDYGTVAGTGYFLDGDEVRVEAFPEPGHSFVGWEEDGSIVSTEADYSFTADSKRILTAIFERNTYAISATSRIDGRGVVTGAGDYQHGDPVTLTAEPAEGFFFVAWRDASSEAILSTDLNYRFTATADADLVADFAVNFDGGSGTELDPWLVSTPEHLDNMRYLRTGHFKQVADIDLGVAPWNEGEGWIPLGLTLNNYLENIYFDGAGHRIMNLTLHRNTGNYIGFIAIGINCHFRGMNFSGGLVVRDGGPYAAWTGILSGYLRDSTINDCFFSTKLIDSHGFGTGMIGHASSVTINNSTVYSDVYAGSNVGGVAGLASYLEVKDCTLRGQVSGVSNVGGVAGETGYKSVCSGVSIVGSINGASSVGGVFGKVYGSDSRGETRILTSHAVVEVRGLAAVGGLVGQIQDPLTIQQSYFDGSVIATGDDFGGSGGIVGGGTFRGGGRFTLKEAYSLGEVSGNGVVGGAVGGGSFEFSKTGVHHTAYSASAVRGLKASATTGGFSARGIEDFLDGDVFKYTTSLFWDITSSGQDWSSAGTGLSTGVMKTKSTYTDAGWDFENVWDIQEGVTYPYLRSVPLSLGVQSADPAQGSVSGAKTSYHQLTETVEATPVSRAYFSHWTDYGDWVSDEAVYSFQMKTHRELVAHFSETPVEWHEITVTTSQPSVSTVSGSGMYVEGDTAVVSVEMDAGYELLGWYEGELLLGTDLMLEYVVDKDSQIEARIQQIPVYELQVGASPHSGGAVSGAGDFQRGTGVSVTASPNEGYVFEGWYCGNQLVSEEPGFIFELFSTQRLVAVFQKDSGFDDWLTDFGLLSTDRSALDFDSDGDGVSNRVEFLEGTSPVDSVRFPTWRLARAEEEGSFYAELWRRRDTHGVEDRIEYSLDLESWRNVETPSSVEHHFSQEVVGQNELFDQIRLAISFGSSPPASFFLRRGVGRELLPLLVLDEPFDDLSRWEKWGSPSSGLLEYEPGNRALKNNGDGSWDSGVLSSQSFDFANGLIIEASARQTAWGNWRSFVIGLARQASYGSQTGAAASVAIRSKHDNGEYTQCFIVKDDGSTEIHEFFDDDTSWRDYKIFIRPDRRVEFFKAGTLLYRTSGQLSLDYNNLPMIIGGRSVNSDVLVDDVKVLVF